MKKLFVLALCVTAFAGCAKKAPLTPEEQWKGYCTSIGNAGRSIMLDRQNGITQKEALEYANKVEDETTRSFALGAIKDVYAMNETELRDDVEARRESYKQQLIEKCVNTPHDSMPDYKPF